MGRPVRRVWHGPGSGSDLARFSVRGTTGWVRRLRPVVAAVIKWERKEETALFFLLPISRVLSSREAATGYGRPSRNGRASQSKLASTTNLYWRRAVALKSCTFLFSANASSSKCWVEDALLGYKYRKLLKRVSLFPCYCRKNWPHAPHDADAKTKGTKRENATQKFFWCQPLASISFRCRPCHILFLGFFLHRSPILDPSSRSAGFTRRRSGQSFVGRLTNPVNFYVADFAISVRRKWEIQWGWASPGPSLFADRRPERANCWSRCCLFMLISGCLKRQLVQQSVTGLSCTLHLSALIKSFETVAIWPTPSRRQRPLTYV